MERPAWKEKSGVVVAGLLVMLCTRQSIESARTAAIRFLALLACLLDDAPPFLINVLMVNALKALEKSWPDRLGLGTEFSSELLISNRSNRAQNTNADA